MSLSMFYCYIYLALPSTGQCERLRWQIAQNLINAASNLIIKARDNLVLSGVLMALLQNNELPEDLTKNERILRVLRLAVLNGAS